MEATASPPPPKLGALCGSRRSVEKLQGRRSAYARHAAAAAAALMRRLHKESVVFQIARRHTSSLCHTTHGKRGWSPNIMFTPLTHRGVAAKWKQQQQQQRGAAACKRTHRRCWCVYKTNNKRSAIVRDVACNTHVITHIHTQREREKQQFWFNFMNLHERVWQ